MKTDTKLCLPDNCEICGSKRVKISEYYKNYYFCLDCKDGKELKSHLKLSKSSEDLLREFEAMLGAS
jgi:hypothetical protein